MLQVCLEFRTFTASILKIMVPNLERHNTLMQTSFDMVFYGNEAFVNSSMVTDYRLLFH